MTANSKRKTSDAQRRASEKWKVNNAERNRYINQRSAARSFIRNKSTADDLNELESLIADRRQTLADEKTDRP